VLLKISKLPNIILPNQRQRLFCKRTFFLIHYNSLMHFLPVQLKFTIDFTVNNSGYSAKEWWWCTLRVPLQAPSSLKLLAISWWEVSWFKRKKILWRTGHSHVCFHLPSNRLCFLIYINPICTVSVLLFTRCFCLLCGIPFCSYGVPCQRHLHFCSSICFVCVLTGKCSLILSEWGLPTFPSLQATGAISFGYPLPCTFPNVPL